MRLMIAVVIICSADRISLAEPETSINDLLAEISGTRIKTTIEKLVSFETRDIRSETSSPRRGIGAARNWILSEMKTYGPRLAVESRTWHVAVPQLGELDVQNVVAVLPGTTNPSAQIVISAHYDSSSFRDPESPAPGADDDGSGTAAVMELARVLSRYEFDKTLVFMLFAGEEYGLLGSKKEAERAKSTSAVIEAVLNNDIIGNDAPAGQSDVTVNVFGGNIRDSPSQKLAGLIQGVGEIYVPALRVVPVPQPDRPFRGGDQMSFQAQGFTAVRFTSPYEVVANQHNTNDTLEHMSVAYTARVTQLNAATAAVLAGVHARAGGR
jgi:Zn-dependent M28 family amino/carboxypeptidase